MFNLFNLIDEENKKQEEVQVVQNQQGNAEEPVVVANETTNTPVESEAAEVCTDIAVVDALPATKITNDEVIDAEFVEIVEEVKTTPEMDAASQIREKMNVANSEEVVTDFSDSDVSEQEKKLEEAEDNKNSIANKVAAAKSTAKTEDKFEPNEFTIIRYNGQDIPVTKYLTAEELAEGISVKKKDKEERKPVTAEELRKRMEKDYPELVPAYTELFFIEKKGATYIVPIQKAKKKGAESVSSDTNSAFPIIPYEILGQFIELAKLFAEQSYEVHADIYFNLETRNYVLDVPGQFVHPYWCEVNEEPTDIIERIGLSSVKVAEIHSHHDMRPIPSAQDNASERVPKMNYIIVGNINDFYPSITARRFNGTNWDKLELTKLFKRPSSPLPKFDGNKISFTKGAVAR